MICSSAIRAAKPAVAVALTGGSVLLLSEELSTEGSSSCADTDVANSRHNPHYLSVWNSYASSRTASCEGYAATALGFITRLSGGGRSADKSHRSESSSKTHYNTSNKDFRRPVSLTRQKTTEEILHDTADLSSVEQKYDVNYANPIGTGMFGNVFRAVNKSSGEPVAIKKIAKRLTNDVTFQHEMNNLLYLERSGGHVHVCALREHFDPPDEDHFYLVLDLVEGGELFEHLCQHGAYSEASAARIIRQTASALAYLHGIGMVHADVKPENLMLSSKNGGEASVKLVDFGCAHVQSLEEENVDQQRISPLTPAYCPPEILERKRRNPKENCEITPSFDIWSLGIVMYVMLTGTHPFDLENNGTRLDMQKKILSGGPLPIRDCEYTKHLSEDALSLLERMMSRDPAERPSAEEILKNRWVKGETASSALIPRSDKRLLEFRRHATQIGTTLFKGLLRNSDVYGGSQKARRTSILEMAFRDLDPKNRGYISTKEIKGDYSFFAPDAELSLPELQHLLKDTMVPLHYSRDNTIFEENTQGDSMYIIQSGKVEVTSKADGFKSLRQSGEFIGEEAVLGESGRYSHTAKCTTPVHVLEISREYYEKCRQNDEEVGTSMAAIDRRRSRERAKVILGLAGSLQPQYFKPGDVIFHEGSQGDLLYMLDSGTVDVSAAGRKVRRLHDGEMTGEHAALFHHKPYNVTAQCISDEGCTMQILHGKKLRQMCNQNKELEESFKEIILRRDFKKALVHATKRDFPETDAELRIVFDVLDQNKNGKLELENELKKAVHQWDESYTEDDVRQMLKSLGLEAKGYMTYEDFRRIFNNFNDL